MFPFTLANEISIVIQNICSETDFVSLHWDTLNTTPQIAETGTCYLSVAEQGLSRRERSLRVLSILLLAETVLSRKWAYGPLFRYAPGMPGTFSHQSLAILTCITVRAWRTLSGSLTSAFRWSRWRGKRSRHTRCMPNPHVYVSGKRHIPKHVCRSPASSKDHVEQWLWSRLSCGYTCQIWMWFKRSNKTASQYKDRLSRYRISMLNIRRLRDPLIVNLGIPLLARRYIYIKTAPRLFCKFLH